MTFYIECTYCGHKWDERFYYEPKPGEVRCSKCKDANVKMRPQPPTVDYYPKEGKK